MFGHGNDDTSTWEAFGCFLLLLLLLLFRGRGGQDVCVCVCVCVHVCVCVCVHVKLIIQPNDSCIIQTVSVRLTTNSIFIYKLYYPIGPTKLLSFQQQTDFTACIT